MAKCINNVIQVIVHCVITMILTSHHNALKLVAIAKIHLGSNLSTDIPPDKKLLSQNMYVLVFLFISQRKSQNRHENMLFTH